MIGLRGGARTGGSIHGGGILPAESGILPLGIGCCATAVCKEIGRGAGGCCALGFTGRKAGIRTAFGPLPLPLPSCPLPPSILLGGPADACTLPVARSMDKMRVRAGGRF